MSTGAALVLALLIAALIVAAFKTKPAKTLVGGVLQRDRDGRLVLVLAPATGKNRKKKRRKRH